jgi:hypothetical protein
MSVHTDEGEGERIKVFNDDVTINQALILTLNKYSR